MKNQIFQKADVGIKRGTLDKVTLAALRTKNPTRTSISEACGVSTTTAGKFFSAMCDSGLAKQKSSQGSRGEKYLDLSELLRVAVIDLSSPTYKMTLMQKGDKSRISTKFECNGEMSPDENLIIFLSKCIGMLAEAKISNYFICVIYADNAPREIALVNYALSKEKSAHVEQIVSEVMRRAVLLNLTVSEALSKAALYGYISVKNRGACYIFIGSSVSMCYINQGGDVIVSSPEKFLIDGETRIGEIISKTFSHDLLFSLCCRMVNLASAAFSPEEIFIESDLIEFDPHAISKHLKARMPIKDRLPDIITRSTEPSLSCLGAYRAAIAEIIGIFLLPSDN
jgi:hypothetical protein